MLLFEKFQRILMVRLFPRVHKQGLRQVVPATLKLNMSRTSCSEF